MSDFKVGDVVRCHLPNISREYVGEIIEIYQVHPKVRLFPDNRELWVLVNWLTLTETSKVKRILANYE